MDKEVHAAVIGSPIGQSLSPVLHRAAMAALAVPGDYRRYEVDAAGLRPFLVQSDHTGLSVTMPLKTEMYAIACKRGWKQSPEVQLTGVVNTVVRRSDGTYVYNTDVVGMIRAIAETTPLGDIQQSILELTPQSSLEELREHSCEFPAVAILGSGATALSALVAAHVCGAGRADIYVRTMAKTHNIVHLARRLDMQTVVHAIETYEPGFHPLTISTLPAGAVENYDFTWPSDLSAQQPLRLVKNREHVSETELLPAVVLDVAYQKSSILVQGYRQANGIGISGERMLLHQAVEQFKYFCPQRNHSDNFLSTVTTAMESALVRDE